MAPLHYVLLPSFFGIFGVVWWEAKRGPKVYQISLPNHQTLLEEAIQGSYAGASNLSCSTIEELGKRIQSFLKGGAVDPFPVVIPCHRAIRSDGGRGGFQGGVEMKRALLENEGIEFTERGKVLMKRVYYGQ